MIKNPFLRRIASPFIGLRAWTPLSLSDLDKLMDEAITGHQTISGASVNADTAMNFSAFFNGTQQICQAVACLPLIMYKRISETKKRRFREHPTFKVLHDMANPFMPAFTWREISTLHKIMAGNAYSFIERDAGYRCVALWPRNPFRMEVVGESESKYYVFNKVDGSKKYYAYDEILHIPGFGFDGIKGYSVLELARESIGLGLSYEEYQSRFISQGAHIAGVLQVPQGTQLGPKGKENLKESFDEKYSSVTKTGKTIVLENGITYNKIGMSLTDAQFLDSRVFSIQEIARWLNIQPNKLKDLSRATYSNIEAENLSFYQETIRPYLIRQEAFINSKICPDDGYAEYLVDALLRTDYLTRMQGYQIQRNMGTLNADEIRAYENLDELPEGQGKYYLIPANMTTIEKMMTQPEKVPGSVGTGQLPIAMENTKLEDIQRSIREIKRALPLRGGPGSGRRPGHKNISISVKKIKKVKLPPEFAKYGTLNKLYAAEGQAGINKYREWVIKNWAK